MFNVSTTPYKRCKGLIAALALVMLLLVPGAAQAQVSGLSYTLSPSGQRLFFDDNAGLDDAFLYGGELGFGFGRFVELSALYQFNNDLKTDFSALTGLDEATAARIAGLDGRGLELQQYGIGLKFNLAPGAAVPFVRLGAGILRFNPDDLNPSETIWLSGGAGLQFSLARRYSISVSAENLSYRYNLGAAFFSEEDLAQAELTPESFNQVQVNNLAVRVGLQLYIGGRKPGETTDLDRALRSQLSGGLRAVTLQLEPFYGTVTFDKDLGFKENQRMAGINAGLNLGPYVGVRGFYWRGMEEDKVDPDELQAYGGALRLNLGSGWNATPYLTLGGGYMDVLDKYEGRIDGETPSDKPFLLAGGGLVLPLGESLRLNGGVRALLMSTEGTDNLSDPNDVTTSLMYSLGLNFVLGAPDRSAGAVFESRFAEARTREERLALMMEHTEARLDSLANVLAELQEANGAGMMAGDSLRMVQQGLDVRGRQMVTFPIPETGEIYIRYGEPGSRLVESFAARPDGTVQRDTMRVIMSSADTTGIGVADSAFTAALLDTTQTSQFTPAQQLTAAQIQQIVRQTLREEQDEAGTTTLEGSDFERLERRLEMRLLELENSLQRQINSERGGQPEQPSTIIIQPGGEQQRVTPGGTVEVRSGDRVEVVGGQSGLVAVLPLAGFTFGDPVQAVVGLRGDYRNAGSFRILPEFVFGLGTGTFSYHASLNGAYSFWENLQSVRNIAGPVRPYVGAGVGFLGFNDAPEDVSGVQFTFNLLIGTEYEYGPGVFFAEVMPIDFGDYTRLLAGYRVNF